MPNIVPDNGGCRGIYIERERERTHMTPTDQLTKTPFKKTVFRRHFNFIHCPPLPLTPIKPLVSPSFVTCLCISQPYHPSPCTIYKPPHCPLTPVPPPIFIFVISSNSSLTPLYLLLYTNAITTVYLLTVRSLPMTSTDILQIWRP